MPQETGAGPGDGAGVNPDGSPDYTTAANQEAYTEESYLALIRAYDNAFTAAQTQELTENEQDKVDSLVAALDEAINNLVEIVEGEFQFILDDSYECEGFNGEVYSPREDTEFMDNFGIEEIYTDDYDYIPVTSVIYGLPAWGTPDDVAEFITVEGGEIEYITFYDPDCIGSGTIAVVLDGNGDIQAVYLLAIRGDMDGDADLTSDDVAILRNVAYGIRGYEFDDPDNPNYVLLPAADTTGDADLDLEDASLVRNMFYGGTPVDQAYGGIVEE